MSLPPPSGKAHTLSRLLYITQNPWVRGHGSSIKVRIAATRSEAYSVWPLSAIPLAGRRAAAEGPGAGAQAASGAATSSRHLDLASTPHSVAPPALKLRISFLQTSFSEKKHVA